MPDDPYREQRDAMVRTQIAARGVADSRVLDVMRATPRHAFVPDEFAHFAYGDHPVKIGQGQTISQPYMVAHMTELLKLEPADRVLEIGTGSGYQTAVLAALAGTVVSIERYPALAAAAEARLIALGYANTEIRVGDGTEGAADRAPFDAILVTAGGPQPPETLKTQLAEGGRLVCPVGPRRMQQLIRWTRRGDRFEETRHTDCVFVPLVGREGWPEG